MMRMLSGRILLVADVIPAEPDARDLGAGASQLAGAKRWRRCACRLPRPFPGNDEGKRGTR